MFSVDQVLLFATLIGLLLASIVWYVSKRFWPAMVVTVAAICVGLVVAWPRPEPVPPEVNSPDLAADAESATNPDQDQLVARTLAEFDPFRPAETKDNSYVSSDACAECHADQQHAWHASYHRTMTQVATPEAVLGNFDDIQVTARGRKYALDRVGDVYWVTMNDPDFPVSPETVVDVPIVMTTGSHHMQVYWYPSGVARTLGQLPIVYLKETQQWVPRNACFLRPTDEPVSSEMGRWNEDCSQCHATQSRSRVRSEGVFDTHVAELGISCEACHGPGEQHIALHRDGSDAPGEDPIVNPSDLSSHASAQVCGQCHSVRVYREAPRVVSERGHSYRPGGDLDQTHDVWQRDSEAVREFIASRHFPEGKAQALRSVFWDDGMVRVAGREFNGMLDSACYVRGEMSCLSCHSMHQDESDERELDEWANDQLTVDALGDEACTQCHTASRYGTVHTHHSSESAGSRCYNCHMPHTTYGLLKAIRSHTIVSPDIARDRDAGRPNACNLCHLDQTLQWSAAKLHDWYGSPNPEFTEEQATVAASVLWLLKGDAGLRALAAWNMGWPDAQTASGNDWIAPLMARTLNDPYPAVRLIAQRTMRSLPYFGQFQFDAVADEQERKRAILAAIGRWEEHDRQREANPQILLDADGSQGDRIERLMNQRDTTRVNLVE